MTGSARVDHAGGDVLGCLQHGADRPDVPAVGDLIVGVKARVGKIAGGSSGAMPLDLALEAAAETGLPVMAHLDNPPPSRVEVLSRLRRGDILTHCFKPFPNAPIRFDGETTRSLFALRSAIRT